MQRKKKTVNQTHEADLLDKCFIQTQRRVSDV